MKDKICGLRICRPAVALAVVLAAVTGTVFATGQNEGGGKAAGQRRLITVISREDGSGTRSTFVELFGVLDGNKKDGVTRSAEITNNTAVMMTSVSGDRNAIGYISLGSLNGTVKALKIDGAVPSAAAIAGGAYKIYRPFNIAVRGTVSPAAQNFINYILSAEGQSVVSANKYLPVDGAPALAVNAPTQAAKIIVAGSSSVTPLMEKLREAYIAKYPMIDIEIQQSDSSTGINSVISGVCDIGMASRELKSSETEKGVNGVVIATDGIAVIVNRENPLDGLSRDQVKNIYLGAVTDWTEL